MNDAGLLQYLHKVVMEQPLEAFDEVFCRVVSPHTFLVLAQTPSDAVRTAVIEVHTIILLLFDKNADHNHTMINAA